MLTGGSGAVAGAAGLAAYFTKKALFPMAIPLAVAMLGGEIQVPTPKGKLELKIPPETQNGRSFRLTGQGMPHLGNSSRGDLLARVKVVLPTNLSPEEKELFKQLSQLRSD